LAINAGDSHKFFLAVGEFYIGKNYKFCKKKCKNYFVIQSPESLYPALSLYEPSAVKFTNKIGNYFSVEEKSG
jgi:hypothetical protein